MWSVSLLEARALGRSVLLDGQRRERSMADSFCFYFLKFSSSLVIAAILSGQAEVTFTSGASGGGSYAFLSHGLMDATCKNAKARRLGPCACFFMLAAGTHVRLNILGCHFLSATEGLECRKCYKIQTGIPILPLLLLPWDSASPSSQSPKWWRYFPKIVKIK